MIPKIFFAFVLICCSLNTLAQKTEESFSHVQRSKVNLEDKPKYFQGTDVALSDEEFYQLFKSGKAVNLIPVIDKYGVDVAFYVDTVNTMVQYLDQQKTPVGEEFPEFVMTGMDGRIMDSQAIRGRKVVLYFNFFFPDNYNPHWVLSFEKAYREHKEGETQFVLVTSNKREEILKIGGLQQVGFLIVPDARNFQFRYGITQYPTCVVLDESGNVLAYLGSNELDQLDDLL